MAKPKKIRKGIGGPKRSPDQRLLQQAQVGELYLAGYTLREIAAKLGISKSQVGYDLEAKRKEWSERGDSAIEQMVNEELARIDRLERLYHEGYERSLRDAVLSKTSEHETIVRTGQEEVVRDEESLTEEDEALQTDEEMAQAIFKEMASGRGRRRSALSSTAPPPISVTSKLVKQTSKSTERRDGDARWLDRVRWCVEMRMKLMASSAISVGTLDRLTTASNEPGSPTRNMPTPIQGSPTESVAERARRWERSVAPLDPKVRVDALHAVAELVEADKKYKEASENYRKFSHLPGFGGKDPQPQMAVDVEADVDDSEDHEEHEEYDETG